jgi:hypothetical protein
LVGNQAASTCDQIIMSRKTLPIVSNPPPQSTDPHVVASTKYDCFRIDEPRPAEAAPGAHEPHGAAALLQMATVLGRAEARATRHRQRGTGTRAALAVTAVLVLLFSLARVWIGR